MTLEIPGGEEFQNEVKVVIVEKLEGTPKRYLNLVV